MSIEEKIADIEEEIKSTSYNKATQHHIGKLKAKLARLREGAITSKGGGRGFGVRKTGHATAVLVGFPSVGKSTLLNKLTDAKSRIGAYDFTTIEVIPGMLEHEGVRIQILDLPGIIGGGAIGKGRGREILSVIRNADIVLMMVDVFGTDKVDTIKKELYGVGIRLDREVPRVRIHRTQKGGIKVNSRVRLKFGETTIKAILNAYGIHNANVTIHEKIDDDELIDVITGNRVYIPSLTIVNKIDLAGKSKLNIDGEYVAISAMEGRNVEVLKEKILKRLNLIRIYLKPRGKEADLSEPLVVMGGSTVGDICDSLHRDFRGKFRYALINGKSVRYSDQKKGLEHVLMDKDIVTIVKRI